MQVAAFAPAKVNLYLQVTGRRADGYHLLDSLVVFADIGDRLTAALAGELSLSLGGPEAALVPYGEDNLVLRAARALAAAAGIEPRAALQLEKNLPVAAGIGGGSSDAPAALRALAALWRVDIGEDRLRALGLTLGADIPACLAGGALRVGGVGERLQSLPPPPDCGILLANPRIPLPTADVFRARAGRFSEDRPLDPPESAAALVRLVAERGNDLTAAAIGLVPEIGAVLDRLRRLDRVLAASMSGSGATCFALFADRATADAARARLAAAMPRWWCAAGALLPARPEGVNTHEK